MTSFLGINVNHILVNLVGITTITTNPTTNLICTPEQNNQDEESGRSMTQIGIDDLVGRTFLIQPHDDGTRARAKIIERIDDHMKEEISDTLLTKPAKIASKNKPQPF